MLLSFFRVWKFEVANERAMFMILRLHEALGRVFLIVSE